MPKRFPVSAALALLVCAGLLAQEAAAAESGEEDFFGSAPVEAEQGAAEKKNLQEEIEKERVGLSGYLQAQGSYTLTRGFARGLRGVEDNPITAAMLGDILVDVRLKRSFRAFLDLNLGFVTENQITLIGLKEAFVDFNIANTLYFRAGKQVLQWGRGYLWNPTDLINIERKSFLDLEALREGVFGLRSDVVFSRALHLYTFLDLNGVANLYDVAFAARTEFLAGPVEFGFSAWVNGRQIPVFGADLSAPLPWRLNLTAEAALSWGDIQDKMDTDGAVYSIRGRLVPKFDVGLSRSFDAWDVQDRITVIAEFYYNHCGYEVNMFEQLNPAYLPLFVGKYYQAGYYGKYNAALFITIGKFILSDMTLSLSGIGNFSDLSGIALASLEYSPVNNFTLSLQLGSYLGADNREYTVSIDTSSLALTSNLLFAALGAEVAF